MMRSPARASSTIATYLGSKMWNGRVVCGNSATSGSGKSGISAGMVGVCAATRPPAPGPGVTSPDTARTVARTIRTRRRRTPVVDPAAIGGAIPLREPRDPTAISTMGDPTR